MLQFVKLFAIILLVTSCEGGMNTIFPPYLELLGVPVSQIGVIISLFGITSLAARLPSGAVYVNHRARVLLSGTLALLALGTAGYAYTGSSLYVVGLTLLHGFAFGAVTTIMLALVIEIKPQNYSYGVTMGWYTASISAGYAIGNSLGGFLADRFGFQTGFVVIGLFPLWGVLLAGRLPRVGPTISPPSAEPASVPSVPESAKPRRLWQVDLSGLTPTILLATLVAFYINFLDDAISTFFPLFGLSIGLSLTTIGALRSAKSLAATGIRPVSGFFFKFVNYRLLNNIAILVWSVVVFFFPSMQLGWVFLIAFIIAGLSRGLIRVTSATMVAEEKSKQSAGLGFASGVYNAGLDVGTFAGPIAGGLLASTFGIPVMFRLVPIGLLIAYLIAVFLVTQTEKRTIKEALIRQ